MAGSILAQRDRLSLENGMDLRLLSALEVLQARREAAELAAEGTERALCSNACLLARALEHTEDHRPLFSDGKAVLAGLTVEEIDALAHRWSDFRRGVNPGLALDAGELEDMKRHTTQAERLRWRVLKAFHALPTEPRAKAMKDRDYLWCLVQMLLDREEELDRLCPTCRAAAEEEGCPVCGQPSRTWGEGGSNPTFDRERFERLKGEGS